MLNKANGENSQLASWDDPMTGELEKLLIPHIKDASQSTIKKLRLLNAVTVIMTEGQKRTR
nr:putative E3 ubiquitin-protein ligase RF4 [Ipomoea batatas]